MKQNFYLERVDLMRGVAILLVLLNHSQSLVWPNFEIMGFEADHWQKIPNWKSFFLNFHPVGQGWIGVELFIVISGFLIHLIYLKNPDKFDVVSFYHKRFWRIFPPFIICCIFFFLVKYDNYRENIWQLTSHLLMIHNLWNDTFFGISPSYWTVALEVQMYLLYPLLLIFIKKHGLLKVLYFTIALHFCFIGYSFYKPEMMFDNAYLTSLPRFWFVWVGGAYLAERYYTGRPLVKNPTLWFWVFFILFFATKTYYYTFQFMMICVMAFTVCFFEMVLYSKRTFQDWVSRYTIPFITYLGVISYSLYLFHQPFLHDMYEYFMAHFRLGRFNQAAAILTNLIIITLAANTFYQYVELGSIKLGNWLRNR